LADIFTFFSHLACIGVPPAGSLSTDSILAVAVGWLAADSAVQQRNPEVPMNDAEIKQTDVLTLMRTYDSPPESFDPHTAPPELLRRHGLPRRPDPETEPELARLFKRAFVRPARYVKAELAIDPVMSRRDPLRGQDPDFGPSGWGGVAVVTSSLGYSPPEPANTVFADSRRAPGLYVRASASPAPARESLR
jgi:hypothetical protein